LDRSPAVGTSDVGPTDAKKTFKEKLKNVKNVLKDVTKIKRKRL